MRAEETVWASKLRLALTANVFVCVSLPLAVCARVCFQVHTHGEVAARSAQRQCQSGQGVSAARRGGPCAIRMHAVSVPVPSAPSPAHPLVSAAAAAAAASALLQVGSKSDRREIDAIVFSNSDEVEKIVRSYEAKSAHESKVQAAYLSDVRMQLEEMQTYQNALDQKLQMALKFIDWFTDVKMKHQ